VHVQHSAAEQHLQRRVAEQGHSQQEQRQYLVEWRRGLLLVLERSCLAVPQRVPAAACVPEPTDVYWPGVRLLSEVSILSPRDECCQEALVRR
jgi:hypothetical protein